VLFLSKRISEGSSRSAKLDVETLHCCRRVSLSLSHKTSRRTSFRSVCVIVSLYRRLSLSQEFYFKCHASQDFIATQIPWATAGADRSREQRTIQISLLPQQEQAAQATELTVEEQLLADLLGANEELLESLRMYDELHALGLEREAEAKSREDTRMPRSVSFGLNLRILITDIIV
jgi:hypothetical protein